MKRIMLVFYLPFLLCALNDLHAQCINGTLSYPLYKDGAAFVKQIDDQGDEIVRIEYDLLFSSKETFRTLTSDWIYVIYAFADEGLKELNLKVYEYDDLLEEWNLVGEDTLTGRYATLNITPSVTAQYKIEIIAGEFNEGYTATRYGLLIYHD